MLCVNHHAHRNSKSRVYPLWCQDSRPSTRSYTAAAGVAVRCCCCCRLGIRTHTTTVPLTSGWRVYKPRRGTQQQAVQQAGPDIYRLAVTDRKFWQTQLATFYHSGDSPRQQQGVGPPTMAWAVWVSELQKPSLYSVRHLSAFLFHVSAIGAIIAAATTNSRRLSQRNPYKTCVSFVELGQTSRYFILEVVHFEKIGTKMFPRYGRCAGDGSEPIPRDDFVRHHIIGMFS